MALINKAAILILTGVVLMIDESKGCYSNLAECTTQYANLSTSMLGPSGLNLTAYCVSVGLIRTCLNKDANCGSAPAPPNAISMKMTVDNAITACQSYLEASPSCQSKLSNCTNIAMTMAMQIGQNMSSIATTNSSSFPDLSSIFAMMCPILTTTKNCYQEAKTVCPRLQEIVPISQYEQQIAPFCGGNSSGGNIMECANKLVQCTNIISSISSGNSTDIQSMCSKYQELLQCYNTTFAQCPSLASSQAAQLSQYSEMIRQTCGGSGQVGDMQCSQEYQKCLSQMQSVATLAGAPNQQYCSTMKTSLDCFSTVSTSCPSMTASISQMTSGLKTMIQQTCGYLGQLPSSCQSKINTCTSTYTSQCLNMSDTMADKIKCCQQADVMIKCITDAGCTDSVNLVIGPKFLFEKAMKQQCNGYQDYCPGLETCLTGVSSFEEFCPKADEVFNCVSTKCSSNQMPANIKQMIKNICKDMQSYPSISTCLAAGQCYSIVMEPFPGSAPTIRSLVDIKSPSYWCRFSKAVSVCNEQIIPNNACELTGNYATDMATLKSTIDNTCKTTRTPCPGAVGCLAIFQSATSGMAQACSGISNFSTCINNALNSCGQASRVQASYSISQIADQVNKFCSVLEKNPRITNCSNARPCLSIPVTGVAEGLSQFTNQTFWADFLASMIKCTTKVGAFCQLPGAATQELTSLSSELKSVIGATDGKTPAIAGTCLSQKDVCMQKFSSTCLSQDTLTVQKQCCGIAGDMVKCLNNANCPDILFTVGVSKGVFESMNKRMCSQSMEYCPGIETCLNGMTSIEQMCQVNLDTLFTCFATKCTSNWNPDMSKMKNVINEMCSGLKKHFKILNCQEFNTCTNMNVPMLPGAMRTLPSMASVNSPQSWCRLNKGISACLGKVAKSGSCSLDNSFSSDYSALKSTIDSTCTGTPEPCLAVTACMSSISGSPSSLVQICDQIPAFATCVEAAYNTCGDSSKIKAEFTISQVSTRYNKFCSVLKKGLGTCEAASTCLHIPETKSVADSVRLFTNQTYMAGLLENMINCTQSIMTSCDQSEATKIEMDAISVEVKALTNPKPVDDNEGNTATSVVSSVLTVFISTIIALY